MNSIFFFCMDVFFEVDDYYQQYEIIKALAILT